MMNVVTFVLFAALAIHSPPPTAVRVVSGVTDDGMATETWLMMLRKRLSPAEYDSVARIRKPYTPAEAAWDRLIRSRAESWPPMIPALAAPFDPIVPPTRVLVVLGNRGADDAFTHDSLTIGFDLAALQANYGDASKPENAELMDRLFRHEFIHVLQKPWLVVHPWTVTTPLDAAILDIWAEGPGNYQSMSARWRSTGGQPSADARQALAELEPRFVARLAAIACASPDAARPLMRDLSSGPFGKKWGALTAALWLDLEPGAMRSFVTSGPAAVWSLAERHLPEALRPVLREVRTMAGACHR